MVITHPFSLAINPGADWLVEHYPSMDRLRFVHNLDSATSGVLLIGKSKKAAARCIDLWSKREVEKEYLALVYGHIGWETTTIHLPILPDPSSDFKMMVGDGGKHATTEALVVERGYLNVEGVHYMAPVSKVKLKPITGRRHQLR